MEQEKYQISPNVQSMIDKGCYVAIEHETIIGKHSNPKKYYLTLKNETGKALVNTRANNLDKGFRQLDKKLEERIQKDKAAKKPFEEFKYKVEQLTDLKFNNNDKAERLSRAETYSGWDVVTWEGNTVEVKKHNAANSVIKFNKFQQDRRVEVNLLNISLWGTNNEKKYLPELLRIIDDYLYVPVEVRKVEFGIGDGIPKGESIRDEISKLI